MAKLIIRTPDGQEREFPLADRPLRIGRGEHNDVVLPDPEKAVSRFHAELRYEDGAYRLVDANTPNGLWVGGERVPEVVLGPGIAVVLGPYTLSLDDASQPPKTVAVPVLAPTMLSAARPEPPPRRDDTPKSVATQPTKRPTTTVKAPLPLSPKVLGVGIAAILLIVATIVGVTLVVRHRRAPQQIAKNETVHPSAPLATAPSVPPEPSTEEKVRDHLEQAQRLFDDKNFDAAANELEQVDQIDASNVAAADLRAKIEAARHPAKTKTAAPSSPPTASAPDARAKLVDQARALVNTDPQTAIKILEPLSREEPLYKPAADVLEQARAKLRDERLTAARKAAENPDDLLVALNLYIEAQKLGAADLEEQKGVREKMQKLGAEAFSYGKQYYAVGDLKKALAFFQRAAAYLPESDPNSKTAKDRIAQINAK